MPKPKKTSKRKPNAAFMRPVQPDEKLSAIVGSKPLPRSELTKKLWDYIKKNKLQDEKKRTQINADDDLKVVSLRVERRESFKRVHSVVFGEPND